MLIIQNGSLDTRCKNALYIRRMSQNLINEKVNIGSGHILVGSGALPCGVTRDQRVNSSMGDLSCLPSLIHWCRDKNGRHFADDIFKCIFLNENVWIPIKTSMKFVPKGPINNISALVQIIAWRRPGDKPLSEPMMVSLTTHICVTHPQCVNG